MRRYRGSNLKIDWADEELMSRVGDIVDDVTLKVAEMTMELARQNLEKENAYETGRLSDQIDIRVSKFKHGGYAVVAQGPGNYGPKRSPKDNPYYASFIELGGHYSVWGRFSGKEGPYIEPRPYLRPAVKKIRKIFKTMMVDAVTGDRMVE